MKINIPKENIKNHQQTTSTSTPSTRITPTKPVDSDQNQTSKSIKIKKAKNTTNNINPVIRRSNRLKSQSKQKNGNCQKLLKKIKRSPKSMNESTKPPVLERNLFLSTYQDQSSSLKTKSDFLAAHLKYQQLSVSDQQSKKKRAKKAKQQQQQQQHRKPNHAVSSVNQNVKPHSPDHPARNKNKKSRKKKAKMDSLLQANPSPLHHRLEKMNNTNSHRNQDNSNPSNHSLSQMDQHVSKSNPTLNKTPKPPPPQTTGFIENVDFIGFENSDQESEDPNQSSSKKKDSQPRGTKRKFGALVTEDQANAIRKKKGSIITPWFDKLSWKGRNVQQMLTAEIGSFVAYIQPTYEEHKLREMIIQMIRRTIQSRWPDADVEPFGSFGTKLYLPAGDIDLVILSAQMMREQKSKILYRLAPLIRENNIGQDVVVIAKAKVPIIKFKTIFGNINVDISINQTNGIVAMKKVNELLDDIKYLSKDIRSNSRSGGRDHPSHRDRDRRSRDRHSPVDDPNEESIKRVVKDLGAAKCLILVIKSLLKQRGMNEVYTGGLGSYSIICLVLSFLQLHPKIQRGDIDPNKNLGVLLLEFFELYGKRFNFDETGISVRKGGYYYSKAHRGWQRERQPYLLSIEDPADETNDIAGGSHNILSVRTVFGGAFDLLSATLYHRHSIQSSRDAASHRSSIQPLLSVPVPKQLAEEESDQIPKDPMAESLLGEIMGVTKELVENRKKNMKLFYSGTLQRLLQLPAPPPPGSADNLKKSQKVSTSTEERRNKASSHLIPSPRDQDRRDHRSKSYEFSPESSRAKLRRTDEDLGALAPQDDKVSEKPLESSAADHRHSRRELVRYDDATFHSPGPITRDSDRKGKRKAREHPNSLPPLWVEDVEPSEVEILKKNFFTDTQTKLDSSEQIADRLIPADGEELAPVSLPTAPISNDLKPSNSPMSSEKEPSSTMGGQQKLPSTSNPSSSYDSAGSASDGEVQRQKNGRDDMDEEPDSKYAAITEKHCSAV